MTSITSLWQEIQQMPDQTTENPIRQVYVWLLTSDQKVVIVSTDGENWQLPGGKPDGTENATQTAVREVLEETGIDLRFKRSDLQFFGEYTIHDPTPTMPPVYRQVRAWISLPHTESDLDLTTGRESTGQRPEDAVRFAQAVPISEVQNYIPWMPKADEYKALRRIRVIQI